MKVAHRGPSVQHCLSLVGQHVGRNRIVMAWQTDGTLTPDFEWAASRTGPEANMMHFCGGKSILMARGLQRGPEHSYSETI
ncbi:hypothetical protein NDU88_001408 [Pleurodeles waltl]|uniref:Uncharacterized protein n=1 Tax=Pleurodeles waltl TaxID=8319 RepID=A0AAV7MKF3_PLEWA|nr:hypothetical protein NDU88_001408 [Pleurodeles waltl]